MYGTMQDFPLTITAIMRHGCGVHGRRTVTTATGEGYRHSSYRDVGQRAGQLANALRRLGVTGDQRVATFMWNNTEHLVTYFAVPSMGAVLHTLNIRLFPEQIAYVTNEAEDRVILVDLSLARLLAPVLPKLDTVHTVIAVGEGDTTPLREAGKTVLRFAELIDAESPDFGWPQIDENSAAAMCYTSGTTGNPKGVVYSHRSSFLHTMAACTTNGIGVGSSDKVLPIVPMFHANGWGLPYAALMAGADLVLPDRHLDARSLIHMVETLKPTLAGAVPTIWNDVMHYLEKDPDHDMSSLRLVACGGSAVPESLMRTFEDKHDVQIRQLWGMTETSPLATMAWPPPGTPDDQHWAFRITQGHGRIFAHNGVVEGLDVLDERLREVGADDLVLGQTDSERVFALITASIRARDGNESAGLIDALRWLAANVPIYAVNVLLSTATDVWALRYPESHELYILDRRGDGAPEFHLRSKRIRAHSTHLRERSSVVFATEPMDDNPRWRLLDAGELVHVDAALRVNRSLVLPDPPRHPIRREDLSEPVLHAQHTSA